METGALVRRIRDELMTHVDQAFRSTMQDRFKSNARSFLGVRTPLVRLIADRHYPEIAGLSVEERLRSCVEALETGVHECRILAFRWAHRSTRDFSADQVRIPIGWIDRYIGDWSDCDDLCMHVIGPLFLRFPAQAMQVTEWCSSSNRWVRRSAAVSLIRAARQGLQFDLVRQVSRALATDRDNLVRKAHGWLLREAGRKRPDDIRQHLEEHHGILPRAVVTMASRKLSETPGVL